MSIIPTHKLLNPKSETISTVGPFTKCVGGKTKVLPWLLDACEGFKVRRYFEPFVGGGALFFELRDRKALSDAHEIHLSDVDPNLIEAWRDIQEGDLKGIEKQLRLHARRYRADPKRYYLQVRQDWNAGDQGTARFLFLRATAFNGLWRYSKRGMMNTPPGSYRTCSIDYSNLWTVRRVLGSVVRTGLQSFEEAMSDNRFVSGDLVYLDPPYWKTFSQYRPEGFSEEQQIDLIQRCAMASTLGARVIFSNSNTKDVRTWLRLHWPQAYVYLIPTQWTIAASGAKRPKKFEILACNVSIPS